MKKITIVLLAATLCAVAFTACAGDDSKLPTSYDGAAGTCVVSIPDAYGISYENNDGQAERITADVIMGKERERGRVYFSVADNAPFRIVTPLAVIEEKNAERRTLVYWRCNDTFYRDCDSSVSKHLFSFAEDTEMTPVYCEYRPVGILLLSAGQDGVPILSEKELFDADGNIVDQDGVHYLYGTYDFEPRREVWKTNLTIETFEITSITSAAAGAYLKRYTVDVGIQAAPVFDGGQAVIVYSLCKIDGHGYLLEPGGASHLFLCKDDAFIGTSQFPLLSHTLKYAFID